MEPEKVSGCRKSDKAPERSNFSQTCSLLSRYLKEKGSFGDLSVEVAKKLEAAKVKPEMDVRAPITTMNLLPNIEKSSEEFWNKKTDASSSLKSTESIPKFTAFGSSDPLQKSTSKPEFRIPAPREPETSQMTIFYAGQVVVFNDLPASKAKEVMSLARAGQSIKSNGVKINPSLDHNKVIIPSRSIASSSKVLSTPPPQTNPDHAQIQPQSVANGSGLGLVRRASLNKFFEKRKDRVTAKAPYPVNNNRSSSPPPEASNIGVDLQAQTSNHLDLNL